MIMTGYDSMKIDVNYGTDQVYSHYNTWLMARKNMYVDVIHKQSGTSRHIDHVIFELDEIYTTHFIDEIAKRKRLLEKALIGTYRTDKVRTEQIQRACRTYMYNIELHAFSVERRMQLEMAGANIYHKFRPELIRDYNSKSMDIRMDRVFKNLEATVNEQMKLIAGGQAFEFKAKDVYALFITATLPFASELVDIWKHTIDYAIKNFSDMQNKAKAFVDSSVNRMLRSAYDIERYSRCVEATNALLNDMPTFPSAVEAKLSEDALTLMHDYLFENYTKIFECIEYGPMLVEQLVHDFFGFIHSQRINSNHLFYGRHV